MPTVYVRDDVGKAVEKLTIDLIVKYSEKFKEGDVLDIVVRHGLQNITLEKLKSELSQKRD